LRHLRRAIRFAGVRIDTGDRLFNGRRRDNRGRHREKDCQRQRESLHFHTMLSIWTKLSNAFFSKKYRVIIRLAHDYTGFAVDLLAWRASVANGAIRKEAGRAWLQMPAEWDLTPLPGLPGREAAQLRR
jgi:hypothetical protein